MHVGKVILAIVVPLLLCGAVHAQTCTANAGALTAGNNIVIDTCTSANQLTSLCNSSTPIGEAADTIYSATLSPGAGGFITVTPTGYDVYVALLQGSCSGGATCAAESDNPGNAAESISLVGRPPGTYFLLLTSFTAPGPGSCGATTIFAPVPVTLQSYSVD